MTVITPLAKTIDGLMTGIAHAEADIRQHISPPPTPLMQKLFALAPGSSRE